jgi:hypothetical protein
MKNYSLIRRSFLTQFDNLLIASGIRKAKNWSEPISSLDCLVAHWYFPQEKRVLRIHEAVDDSIILDCWLDNTGANHEFKELVIITYNCVSLVSVIFEIYQQWFIDLTSEKDMETYLLNKESKINIGKE